MWSIVDLPYCVSFRCTAKWFGDMYIFIFILLVQIFHQLDALSVSSDSSFLAPHPKSVSLPDHSNLPRPSSSLPSKRKPFSNIAANATLLSFHTLHHESAPLNFTLKQMYSARYWHLVGLKTWCVKVKTSFKKLLMLNTTSNQNTRSLKQGPYSFKLNQHFSVSSD